MGLESGPDQNGLWSGLRQKDEGSNFMHFETKSVRAGLSLVDTVARSRVWGEGFRVKGEG